MKAADVERAHQVPPRQGRLRVAVVYGTRPEAIKMAPVVRALRRRPDRFQVTVCATGQHRELLEQVHGLFGLRPDVDLDLMRPGQTLNELAAHTLLALDRPLRELRPDWLLVQGDTTTAASAALAAFHLRLRVGHVEAGLRTGDLQQPFPEEANRRIVDSLAEALFAPTIRAARQLSRAGCRLDQIFLTGNTGIDALHWVCGDLPEEPAADEVLVTLHRRESFGRPLRGMFSALRQLAQRFPGWQWIFPVHPNPEIAPAARELLRGLPNFHICQPLSYRELVGRLRRARMVLTDSGGIQEEAPAFGKPVLVLRDATERPEAVEAGVARLVGTAPRRIVAETSRLLTDALAYDQMARTANPYGDGHAAERIASILAGEPFVPFGGVLAQDALLPALLVP
ncbi:MAG TPA: UDP-N-acetylglucosamine 2-epimerase (non-hydrolyzing) [Thermoanaerobaculia bacterium]|nr:UDP-N-acetylglucosamine 2-epimerase (non-hydrolyzing) [Thermoanaerobaculia bacterium]